MKTLLLGAHGRSHDKTRQDSQGNSQGNSQGSLQGRAQHRAQSRMICLLSGLPIALTMAACFFQGTSLSPGIADTRAMAAARAKKEEVHPPRGTQGLLKYYLQVNGPLPMTDHEIGFSLISDIVHWPSLSDGKEHPDEMVWVADWSPAPLQTARAVCEESTGNLRIFSCSPPNVGDPMSAEECPRNPSIQTKAQVEKKVRKYLRYFRKTEWIDTPLSIFDNATGSPAVDRTLSKNALFGGWMIVAHQNGQVMHMNIEPRLGNLLFFSIHPDRTGTPPAAVRFRNLQAEQRAGVG